MPELQVTYYTGDWSEDDRAEVRAALAATGFDITEDEGTVKSWQAEIPPQLIVDVLAVIGAGATLVTFINGLLDLYDRVRRRKPGGGSLQVFAPHRAYIVPFDLDADSAHDAVIAIAEDFADGNDGRRGDMTWRDGRWNTYEELHGLATKKPQPTTGHKREGVTRVRRGRKGRRGQAR
jgi:hypothetical protein